MFEWSKSLVIRFLSSDKNSQSPKFRILSLGGVSPSPNAIYKILLPVGILTHPMLITAVYQFSTQTSPGTSIMELGSWPG